MRRLIYVTVENEAKEVRELKSQYVAASTKQ
jgi:hypothetical protein